MSTSLYPGAASAPDGLYLIMALGTDHHKRCVDIFDPQGDRVMMIVVTPYVPEDDSDAEMTTS